MTKLMASFAIGGETGTTALPLTAEDPRQALMQALTMLGRGAFGWIQIENGRWLRRDAFVSVWLEEKAP